MAFRALLPAVLLVAALAPAAHGNRFLAARCISAGPRCTPFMANNSQFCKAAIGARRQSPECLEYGCTWCRWAAHRALPVCTNRRIMRFCQLPPLDSPMPMPEDAPDASPEAVVDLPEQSPDAAVLFPEETPFTLMAPAQSPAAVMVTDDPLASMAPEETPAVAAMPPVAGCTYDGDDRVVMDMGAVAEGEGWTSSTREGLDGLVFEANKKHGIVPAATQRKICFTARMQQAGKYYFTALTSAADNRDNNDMWVSSSTGFELYRAGDLRVAAAGEFLKAYQNRGLDVMADTLSTVDHDRHTFIVKDVQAGVPFEVCVAGRSFMFEVYRLHLIKCDGEEDCTPAPMRVKMGGKTTREATQCL